MKMTTQEADDDKNIDAFEQYLENLARTMPTNAPDWMD